MARGNGTRALSPDVDARCPGGRLRSIRLFGSVFVRGAGDGNRSRTVSLGNEIRSGSMSAASALCGAGIAGVGGDYVTLTGQPQMLAVDVTTPATSRGTPQFSIRTHDAGAIDAFLSSTSVRRLTSGTVDFPGNVTSTIVQVITSQEHTPNEMSKNLADGDVYTNWLAGAATVWVTCKLAQPTAWSGRARPEEETSYERDLGPCETMSSRVTSGFRNESHERAKLASTITTTH